MANIYDDDKNPSTQGGGGGGGGVGVLAMLIPFATALGALGVGLVVGGGLGYALKPSNDVRVEVPRDLSADELLAACAPQVEEKAEELATANTKVSRLENDVRAKEARVAELEGDIAKRNERGAVISNELKAARAELESLRTQLATALQEKAVLEEELKITVAKLEDTETKLVEQTAATERAKEDALVNKFERFKNAAQLEICEKGGRKKMGKCREAVLGYLGTDAIRDKFAHCVRSGSAMPSVHEMTEKNGTLPDYSQWMNQDDKIVKDWYLLSCDPTLPERDGFLNEQALPPTEN